MRTALFAKFGKFFGCSFISFIDLGSVMRHVAFATTPIDESGFFACHKIRVKGTGNLMDFWLKHKRKYGAASGNRTPDPALTMGVLYP